MTSIETGPTWSERLNPRNWTLAWKLVVVGLVPALLALVLGVLRVADQAGEAADLGRSSRLLEVQERVAGAADALRQERDEATIFVAGNRAGDRGVLDIGFGQADGEVDEMLGAVRSTSELDPTTVAALQQTEGELSQLAPLRADAVENVAVNPEQVRSRYDAMVDGIDVLDRALLRQLRTPGAAGLADALTAVTSATEQLAVQHTVLGAAIRAGRVGPADITDVSATDSQLSTDFREYQVALTPEQLTRFGNFLDDASNAQRERLKAAILATPPDRPITLAPYEWDTAYNGSRSAADRSADLLRNELVATSIAAEEQASNLAGVNSVILMLGLLVGITIAILLARALIRSLRVLRTSALDVAERRLPQAVESMRAGKAPDVTVDPVPITGRDEVAQVARAFDAVHGQAVRLAADQAALQSNVSAMFVNLSRRSQALVERQLQLIEQLESNEQDPDQLSNLFQLDHLATRMRRNSENLLVLAGTDLAKRNIAPVPMVDVLRAAVSEIEQYQRIVVQSPPTATVAGRAASDVVHLLAELLDNATNFSPPDSQVVMSTARTIDGSIIVEIADRGVGMIDHELSDANQRLGGPSTVDVSASRRMGLFVVGRLAARHRINVRLSTSSTGGPGSGLTASVTVPGHLIPSGEPASSRPVGVPQTAGISAQGGGALPQRGGRDGGRPGSLSALVAGTDGPSNPAGVFDAPPAKDSRLFSPPPSSHAAQGNTPPTNGLPTRRPGSNLRPNEPPERPDPADQAAAGQAAADQAAAERIAAEKARDVAEQARRDQEAAAARAAADTDVAQSGAQSNGITPHGAPTNGSHANGSNRNGNHSDAARSDTARQEGSRGDATSLNGFVPTGSAPDAAANGSAPADARSGDSRSDDSRSDDSRSDDAASSSIDAETAGQAPSASEEPAGELSEGTAENDGLEQAERDDPGRSGTEQADQEPSDGEQSAAEQGPTERPVGERTGLEQARPGEERRSEPSPSGGVFGNEPLPQRNRAAAVSPPTMPMPVVGRAPMPPPRPVARPDRPTPFQQGAPRPFPQPAPQRSEQAGPSSAPAQPFSAPAAPPRQPDGLFAPSVPVIAEPGGWNQSLDGGQDDAFERGETTPIFEEIASAWFRSNRPIPVTWETEQEEATAPPPPAPTPVRRPSPTPAPAPVPAPAEPVHRSSENDGAPDTAAPGPEFATTADEGWRAASGVGADRADELTAAGLPKRRPRARLVPGSAGSAVLAPPVTSARSAETVRGRLASYQQGVRQGRESRMRGDTGSAQGANGNTGPATAGGNHDEETS